MRKAPRVVRGAETEGIESDQAVHALVWEPVPVPMQVMDLELRPQIIRPAMMPGAEEISSAAQPMVNTVAQALDNVNTQIAYGDINGDATAPFP